MYVSGIPNGDDDGTRVIGDSNPWLMSTIGSVMSIVFLAVLVTCACCAKGKRSRPHGKNLPTSVQSKMGDDEVSECSWEGCSCKHRGGKDAIVQDRSKLQPPPAPTQAPPQDSKQPPASAIAIPVQKMVPVTPQTLPDSMGKSPSPPIPEPPKQVQTPQLPVPVTTTVLKTSSTKTDLLLPMATSTPAPGKKAVEAMPNQAPVPPPNAGTARFDDPAYRTLGLGLDHDPFDDIGTDHLPPVKKNRSPIAARIPGKSQAVSALVTSRDAALAAALMSTLKTATAGTVEL